MTDYKTYVCDSCGATYVPKDKVGMTKKDKKYCKDFCWECYDELKESLE